MGNPNAKRWRIAPDRSFSHAVCRQTALWAFTPLFSPGTSFTAKTFRVFVVMIGSIVSVTLSRPALLAKSKIYSMPKGREVAVSHYLCQREALAVFGLSSGYRSSRQSAFGNQRAYR